MRSFGRILPNMRTIYFIAILALALTFCAQATAIAKDTYNIIGQLIDEKTGEPIVGGIVLIEGTTIGAQSDIDGNYIIRDVDAGIHTLTVQCVGYQKMRLEGFKVTGTSEARLNLSLTPTAIQSGEVVKVTAERVRNTEASLLKERQLSLSVSDAIAAEAISRAGASDAADALTKVTGATVLDGKFTYIRGLGDRYANTRLNGSKMPSTNPDKQATPMDMFPTSLLDNIVVEKTFTPDKPGDFAGGSVNISTKQLTGERILKFSTSAGIHSEATFNGDFIDYPGGGQDWVGFNDGTYDMPDIVEKSGKFNAPGTVSKRDSLTWLFVDEASHSFNKSFFPTTGYAPMNQSYSLSYGNTLPLFNQNVSILGSMNYGRSYNYYEDGVVARWKLPTRKNVAVEQYFSDEKGIDEVHWGGLLNFIMPVSTRHKFDINYMYNRSAESESRYLEGRFPEAFVGDNEFFETRVLRYTIRDIGSFQMGGEHLLTDGRGIRADWQFTYASANQDEPDLRKFSDNMILKENDEGGIDTTFVLSSNQNPPPSRTWRWLDEFSRDISGNIAIPFNVWDDRPAKLKFGSGFLDKKRYHREREFDFNLYASKTFDWDTPEDLVLDENIGIIGTDRFGNYVIGMVYTDESKRLHNYNGFQEIFHSYGMIELPIMERLTAITGARFERTLMWVTNPAGGDGEIDEKDWLPSLNLVYKLTDKQNLRAAYGKTLARPSFREFAPFASSEYATDFVLSGNPELKRTLIDNWDLRWEYFTRPGEIVAVSLFYKDLKNPIEKEEYDQNNNVKFVNVDKGIVYGAEFEVRRRLDFLGNLMSHFQIGANFTIAKSEVDIPEDELEDIKRLQGEDAEETRPLFGQSEYVVNMDIAYDNPGSGTTVAAYYNVFGERLVSNAKQAMPDAYEQPRHMVDLTFTQKVWRVVSFKASVKNLFKEKYHVVHKFEDEEYTRFEHDLGRRFSFGTTINF